MTDFETHPVGTADRIVTLKAQLAEKEEQLVSVLRREAATHDRHDAKVARLEALNPNRPNELTDPIAVHANMLRGTIAKPTVEQIIHLYGVDALCKALVPVIVQEADVNKTPKCERDSSNVLTESAADARAEALKEAVKACKAVADELREDNDAEAVGALECALRLTALIPETKP